MSLSRRRFFTNTLGLLGLSGVASTANATTCSVNDKPLNLPKSYRVVTAGKHAHRHALSQSVFDESKSILMELDLTSGEWKETLIPVANAHEIFVMPEREQFVIPAQNHPDTIITDLDGKVLHQIASHKEGYVYSGHGIKHPTKDVLLLSMYKKEGMSDGILAAYDIGSYKFLDAISTGGTGPHDLSLMEDGKTMALAHYGEAKVQQQKPDDIHTYYHPTRYSKLTLIDIEAMKVKGDLPYDVMNSAFGHLASGNGDKVYGVIEMYHNSTPNEQESETDILARREELMKDERWSLLARELEGTGMAVPTPLVEFDIAKNSYKTHFISNMAQRRPQSVIHHQTEDTIVAAYVFSNHIVTLKNGKINAYDSGQFYIRHPIAVSEIPDTSYLVIGGMQYDLAIVDMKDMSLVKHYPKELFRCSHTTVYTV